MDKVTHCKGLGKWQNINISCVTNQRLCSEKIFVNLFMCEQTYFCYIWGDMFHKNHSTLWNFPITFLKAKSSKKKITITNSLMSNLLDNWSPIFKNPHNKVWNRKCRRLVMDGKSKNPTKNVLPKSGKPVFGGLNTSYKMFPRKLVILWFFWKPGIPSLWNLIGRIFFCEPLVNNM